MWIFTNLKILTSKNWKVISDKFHKFEAFEPKISQISGFFPKILKIGNL